MKGLVSLSSRKIGLKKLLSLLLVVIFVFGAVPNITFAANPYLPLWEAIPDAEPYIFEDPDNPGQYRVYMYGSHDNGAGKGSANWCGPDHVVWSAPVDDLNNWRHEGICFSVEDLVGKTFYTYGGSPDYTPTARTFQDNGMVMLYAPDVAYNSKLDKYFLYAFTYEGGITNQPNNLLWVASSDSPAGPFEDPVFVPAGFGPNGSGGGFDPGVLVDEDDLDDNGYPKVYLYTGILSQHSYMLDGSDMITVIPGSHKTGANQGLAGSNMGTGINGTSIANYFEASSPRKIGDFYVMVYAGSNTLNYLYSKEPFGYSEAGDASACKVGGRLIFNGGETIANPYGTSPATYNTNISNNTHGGLVEVDGEWYLFYHRHTNMSGKGPRQPMVEKVNLRIQGDDLMIDQAEMTSLGFETDGLDPFKKYDAAITSDHYTAFGSGSRTNANSVYLDVHTYDWTNWDPDPAVFVEEKQWNPVTNISNRSWVGYKYFNFGDGFTDGEELKLALTMKDNTISGTINIYAGGAKGSFLDPEQPKTLIGTIALDGTNTDVHTVEGFVDTDNLTGKKGIYLEFLSSESGEICKLNNLQFVIVEPLASNAEKAYLKKTINYAEAQMLLPDYESVIEDVRDAFEATLTVAQEVYDDPDATSAQVNAVTDELLKWIWSLELKVGDKALLKLAIDRADLIDLANYITQGQDEFLSALEEAKEVYDSPNSLQEEVDEAADRLIAATLSLRFKANMQTLNSLLQKAKLLSTTNVYTEESINSLLPVIRLAESLSAEDGQDAVDKVFNDLLSAIEKLTLKGCECSGNTVFTQLSKATGLTLTVQKATWKNVDNNNGYTLEILQGQKVIKTVQIGKGKTSYNIPKNLLKKGKKYSLKLVAKGSGNYTNSTAATNSAVTIKQLSKPKGLKLTQTKATWKKVANNNGYTLKILQGKKVIKTVQIKKGKGSYTIPKNLLKKGKTHRFELVAKGTGIYMNSKSVKSKAIKK